MAPVVRAPLPAPCLLHPSSPCGQDAPAALAFYRSLMALQDAQTAWWKGVERSMTSLMQPWIDTSAPAVPPLAAAAGSLAYPQFVEVVRQAWRDCGQLWLDALRHDVDEG